MPLERVPRRVHLIGLRRRDLETAASVRTDTTDVTIVYAAQTAESKRALRVLLPGVVLEWALVIAALESGVCVWQFPPHGEKERVLYLPWTRIQTVGLVSISLGGPYSTPTLQLSVTADDGSLLAIPFIVRRGAGSLIGRGTSDELRRIVNEVQDRKSSS